jgi:ribosome-binding protein aMBF1 (putative translation factor)
MTGHPAAESARRPGSSGDVVSGPPTPAATEEDYRRQIGRRARVARVHLDLSRNDIATKAGVTRNFVSAIERGAQGLDTWRLRQLADALGVPLGWLLGLTQDTRPTDNIRLIDAGHVDPRSPGASS